MHLESEENKDRELDPPTAAFVL